MVLLLVGLPEQGWLWRWGQVLAWWCGEAWSPLLALETGELAGLALRYLVWVIVFKLSNCAVSMEME